MHVRRLPRRARTHLQPSVLRSEHGWKKKSALGGVLQATRYSLAGLAAAARHEAAFRGALAMIALLLPLALWLGTTPMERVLLTASLLIVLIAELLNSALEATLDRISLEEHSLVKRAKDMGSAAVMLSLLNAALTWAFLVLT
jgi:diacylglycerol kinase (ATP)